MSVLEVKNVSIRYITGDFKDIGLKEYTMKKLKGEYHVTEFWADRDVSFTLEKGEMLGIIGTNGAGKSTLLKAVAGIMEPTEGHVRRKGNIAALLELASGFDGDLTVRENAYLRGAMLGYTRKFMDETYDQIIDFAELRDFQDRPFRQLSSGMKSRLAFSIASLVQPDILILDEVLSVGDGAFRKKSEEKMREIIAGGAATILVSHSVQQVRELCTKVLWLDHGKQIALSNDVEGVCDLYQRFLNKEIGLEEAKQALSECAQPPVGPHPSKPACAPTKKSVTQSHEKTAPAPEPVETEEDAHMDNMTEAPQRTIFSWWKTLSAPFRLAVKSASIAGIIVHLYIFTNLILNHDSVWRTFYDNDNLASGRWALEFFSSFSTGFQLPVVAAVISIVMLSLSAGLTVSILNIKNPAFVVLTSLVLVSFPAVACIFSYLFTVDAYFIGLFLNAAGAYLVKKYRYGWIPAIILLATACGIYQAFLCYAIGLLLFDCILMLISGNSIQDAVKTGVKYVLSLVLSLLAYYAVLKILLNIHHVSLSEYQGLQGISLTNLGAFFLKIPQAYKDFLKYFIKPSYLHGFAAFLCQGLFMLFPALLCALIVVKKIYRNIPRLILTIIGFLLIPLGLNFITVLVIDGSIHELMRYSFVLYFVFAFKIAEELTIQLKATKGSSFVSLAAIVLGVLLSWNYFCVSNIAYLRLQICYENSFALANRIVARIELLDSYSPELPVAIVGEAPRALYGGVETAFSQYGSLTGTTDKLLYSPEPHRRTRTFIEDYIGLHMPKPSSEQKTMLQDSEYVQAMPCYPQEGSVVEYEGVIVVKLSDGTVR